MFFGLMNAQVKQGEEMRVGEIYMYRGSKVRITTANKQFVAYDCCEENACGFATADHFCEFKRLDKDS